MEEASKRILLVEDDHNIAQGVITLLELEKFSVNHAENLKQANLILTKNSIDLVLLDVGLPDGSGLDFCEEICRTDGHPPVVMLTSKTDEESVVKGLENGATDYVKKPFSNRELLARIRVVLREKKAKDTITVYGPIRVNQEKREIVIDGKELKLDRRQYDILQLFVVNAERVLTRERIIENLDAGEEISDRTIDSHVSHIRKIFRQHKVEEIKISSIYGVGYRLEQK